MNRLNKKSSLLKNETIKVPAKILSATHRSELFPMVQLLRPGYGQLMRKVVDNISKNLNNTLKKTDLSSNSKN